MKNLLIPVVLFALVATSCNTARNTTTGGSYEIDEVYYQPGDTFISDYALADNEPESTQDNQNQPNTPTEDDYYNPDTSNGTGNVTNNFYGDYYNYSGLNGFRGRYYNSAFGWPNYYSSWSPYSGWSFGINYSIGFYNGFGWYDPWGWNNPWYNTWGYNPYCWNTWNQPYGFYNPHYAWGNPYYGNYWYNGYGQPYYGNSWGWNDNTGGSRLAGHRPSISSGSHITSSYQDGVLATNRIKRPANYQGKEVPPATGNSVDVTKPNENNSRENDIATAVPQPGATVVRDKNPETGSVSRPVQVVTTEGNSRPVVSTKVPAGKPNIAGNPNISVNNTGRTNTLVPSVNPTVPTVNRTNISRQPTINLEQPNNRPSYSTQPERRPNAPSVTPGREVKPVPSPGRTPEPAAQPDRQPGKVISPSRNEDRQRDNSFSIPSSPGRSTGGGNPGGGGGSRSGGGGGGGGTSGPRRK